MYRCAQCGAFNRVRTPAPEGEPICGKCKRPLDLSGAPQAVDFAGMQRAIASSEVPVLVDFWATWCGPCRMAAPILEQLGREKKGALLVLKVDTDANPQAGATFGFRGIPTFIVFAGGQERARQSGVLPAPAFTAWVERATGG